MYEGFYGLREKPFNLTPDPKFLFLSEVHKGALGHLLYGIRRKEGFMVITGDIGTGKTTICRVILDRLDKTKTALVLNPLLSEDELLRTILQDFGIGSQGATKKELIDNLNVFLLGLFPQGYQAVLIIDEAQNLSPSVLEQVRLLSNLETEKEKLLQIVLVGQAELRKKLRMESLKQVNQRISIRYHLGPLRKEEVPRYINHRLMVAGSDGRIQFSKGALKDVYRYSGGIPRLMNLICDRALLAGYTAQTDDIGRKMIKQGIESLGEEGQLHRRRRFLG